MHGWRFRANGQLGMTKNPGNEELEIAEGTEFGKGRRDDNLRMDTPVHEANSTAYALLCQDTPPQHKKIEGMHLSSLNQKLQKYCGRRTYS